MADYSPGPPLSPEVKQRLDRDEKNRKAAEKARVADYVSQIRRVLDRGTIITAGDLHSVIVAQNQPNSNEIWDAIREVTYSGEYKYDFHRLGKPQVSD